MLEGDTGLTLDGEGGLTDDGDTGGTGLEGLGLDGDGEEKTETMDDTAG